MNLSGGRNGSGEEEEATSSRKTKKQYHRHSTKQIQQLEAFYRECPHPDKIQRQRLSDELALDHKQIKFWFQNKRTQVKAQNEKADNNSLRSENEKIHYENLTMQQALKNIVCPHCSGLGIQDEEMHRNLQMLRMENAKLKEEHERTVSFFSNYVGGSPQPSSLPPLPGVDNLTNIMPNNLINEPAQVFNAGFNQNPTPWCIGVQERAKSLLLETVVSSMDELMELLRLNEPVWVTTPAEDRYLLHRDSYDKLFPKPTHFKSGSARFESSKDSGEVAMAPLHLVELFSDANKWKDMFPNIVSKAKTIEVVDTGALGGSLCLMYEKMHVFSPLVAPREFFFIRSCRQLNSSAWLMVDVSHDFMRDLHDVDPTRAWKLPSGCMIEDLGNGKSKVTWIEHVQVDDKLSTHRLYRDLVSGCEAYGAKRWIATLKRTCERFAFSTGITTTNKHELEGVISSPEGRKNLMKLSHQMTKDFCETLSMSDKIDFPNLSEFKNSGVRVSMRKSNGIGQPDGFILCAATSIWLPVNSKDLFNFFKDEKKRVEWDVLSNGNPINSVADISTGTHPGNCISLIQPFLPKENGMMMLQESIIEGDVGSALIYAPIDLPTIISVVNEEDVMNVPILPSGYVISNDGSRADQRGPSSSSSAAAATPAGSLLTVAFQILVCHSALTKKFNMESVATVHALISSTILKIKAALNCSD